MSDPRDDPEPRGVELWLAPFFRDASLWPVTAVVAAIAVVFGASALLLALERNVFAAAAVALLFWISFDACWRQSRRGGSKLLLGCVTGFWGLSAAAALAVHWAGWF